ncbi:MAG: PTS transporter subunit EIIB [Flavonifractor plautii]
MTNQELSRKILELVGGKSNVVSAVNCMTRLRIQLKDSSLAQIDELKRQKVSWAWWRMRPFRWCSAR